MTVVWIVLHAQGLGPADGWGLGQWAGQPPTPPPWQCGWRRSYVINLTSRGRGGEVHDRLTSSVAKSNHAGWSDHKFLPGQVMEGNPIPDR